jgi:uncharacterized protein
VKGPRTPVLLRIGCATLAALLVASCAPAPRLPPPPVTFEMAGIWLVTGQDSISLQVEVAATPAQAERGLMHRAVLDPGRGMLFLFDEPRAADDGFWMWRTPIPLDLAVLDQEGRIAAILGMDPCGAPEPEGCTPYIPGVPHWAALEVPRGWFARNGVGVGTQVVLPGR